MELQQMRYVVAVAEERNFTRAAERCRVVQSALSHQVKALERELGVRLFARTSRRVELTAAGEAFLPHARASLESAERAIADAASAAGEVRGTLTIGLIPTVTALEWAYAELVGKEAAVYVPSGTMANQIAMKCHTQPGDEIGIGKASRPCSRNASPLMTTSLQAACERSTFTGAIGSASAASQRSRVWSRHVASGTPRVSMPSPAA